MDEGASGYMPSTMSTNPTYRHTSADTVVSISTYNTIESVYCVHIRLYSQYIVYI